MKEKVFGYLSVSVAALFLAGSAGASIIDWTATLDTEQPVHDLVDLQGTEEGSGEGALDTDTGELSWMIQWSGLTGPVVGAHFHEGAPGVSGPVTVDVFSFDPGIGETLDPTDELTGSTADPGFEHLTQAEMDQFLAGDWYFNVHTEANPAGEIRGQAIPAAAPPPVAVPAPALVGLLGLGLLYLAMLRRWRD